MPARPYPITQPVQNALDARSVLRNCHFESSIESVSDVAVDRVIEAAAFRLCELWQDRWPRGSDAPSTDPTITGRLCVLGAFLTVDTCITPDGISLSKPACARLRQWFGTASDRKLFITDAAGDTVRAAIMRRAHQTPRKRWPIIHPADGVDAVLDLMMTPAHAARRQAALLVASTLAASARASRRL